MDKEDIPVSVAKNKSLGLSRAAKKSKASILKMGRLIGQPIYNMAHFGTVNANVTLLPNEKSATNLQELFEEFKMYRKLRK